MPFFFSGMERAHVLVRLRGDHHHTRGVDAAARSPSVDGVCRTSDTTVRLEHNDMSPGVASISFERVFDTDQTARDMYVQSFQSVVERVLHGSNATILVAGADKSGKSSTLHGRRGDDKEDEDDDNQGIIIRILTLLLCTSIR